MARATSHQFIEDPTTGELVDKSEFYRGNNSSIGSSSSSSSSTSSSDPLGLGEPNINIGIIKRPPDNYEKYTYTYTPPRTVRVPTYTTVTNTHYNYTAYIGKGNGGYMDALPKTRVLSICSTDVSGGNINVQISYLNGSEKFINLGYISKDGYLDWELPIEVTKYPWRLYFSSSSNIRNTITNISLYE